MRITDIHGFVLSSPYGGGNVLGQPLGVKSIGLVEVHTDNGLTGVGETYCGIYVPELIEPAVAFLSPLLVGMEVDPPAVLRKAQIPFVSRNGLFASVYSAIDIALWDILGQSKGLPIYKLLSGGDIGSVRVYASGGSAAMKASELEADILAVREQGFDAYKMRIGFQGWGQDLERLRRAREVMGADTLLMIDAIMGTIQPPWNVSKAVECLRQLEEFDPFWVEEPLHPDDLLGLLELRKNVKVRIAAGEALTGILDYSAYLSANAVDIIQIDATHCGGITVALQIIEAARSRRTPVALHVWGSGSSLAANTHVAFASEHVQWLEIPMVSLELTPDMYVTKPVIKNGYAYPPEAPGLGVRIPQSMKNKYPVVKGSGYKLPSFK